MTAPVVVIDNGTGFTKMGYAGNDEPSYIIPSTYAGADPKKTVGESLADLEFGIGEEAMVLKEKRGKTHPMSYPMAAGVVQDWDKMEKVWQQCFYKYLRVEPESAGVVLTEPPANPPENREYVGEVMFETFSVKQLHIAVQGVLALTAARGYVDPKKAESGVVIDAGDGVTHVVPIMGGMVLTNAIKHIPMAGRTLTNYILEKLREREGKKIPSDEALQIAQKVKERYCYVCPDMADEFNKYDEDPTKWITTHTGKTATGVDYSFEVGPEKFIAPELFFNPGIFSDSHNTPIHKMVDSAIMSSPIDCRVPLYANIVLSGGTTMFKGFSQRLQLDMDELMNIRLQKNLRETGREMNIPVKVVSHRRQRYAVWNGGSVLGASERYQDVAITKELYEEWGPNILRGNAMYADIISQIEM